MKRIKAIAHEQGVGVEITEGSNHTLVRVGDRRTTIPRHTEINEITALNILKQLEPSDEGHRKSDAYQRLVGDRSS